MRVLAALVFLRVLQLCLEVVNLLLQVPMNLIGTRPIRRRQR